MDPTQSKGMRVLLLPWLGHGHVSPFLELAKRFTDRNVHIHFCSTAIVLSSIEKNLGEKYSPLIQLVELHLPPSTDLPPHYHTSNGLPPHLMTTLKDAYDMAGPSFSNVIQTVKPDLLIYDYNQPWAAAIAASLGIPAVLFLVSGASAVSFTFHMFNKPGKKYPFAEIDLGNFQRLAPVESHFDPKKEKDRFVSALKQSCEITLIKGFREIESKYIEYLSDLTDKRVVPVGPLVQDPVQQDEHTEIIQWLDTKEESSAVFVSFGSEFYLTKVQIEEIAHGLELSNVNFIWAVRFPTRLGEKSRVEEALPEGYLERVRERGMVVEGWVPQAKILGHRSTGGYVTHCGYGSMMESMKFGVPVIAMPMQYDHPTNARLVEEIGVGEEIMRNKNGEFEREEIAKVIRKVVVEKNGESVRIKAKELRETMRVKGDKDMDTVVEELMQLCRPRASIS